jgi:hypothetical protein
MEVFEIKEGDSLAISEEALKAPEAPAAPVEAPTNEGDATKP